jgi:hypothetical protein
LYFIKALSHWLAENRRPQQPQAPARINKHRAIGVGIAGRIGHCKARRPLLCAFAQARTFDLNIVGGTFARAVKPTDEQVAVRAFDDARSVVVPMFEREDQLGPVKRRASGSPQT